MTFFRLAQGAEVGLRIRNIGRAPGFEDLKEVPLAPVWKPLIYEVEGSEPMPDLFNHGGRYVISARLRRICESLDVAAEYLPVKLKSKTAIFGAYCVLHPLERIDCINYDQSQFEKYGSGESFTIKRFSRLVLDTSAIGNRHLVRPARYPALYVSSAFKEAVAAENLSVAFKPLEGQVAF